MISNLEVIGDARIPKMTQITELNAQLQSENESLKSQLNRALRLTNELELLHKEKRDLNTKIIENDQKITNYQNRLQISQEKNKELQAQIDGFERVKTDFKHEKDMIISELEKVKSENIQLQQANQEYKQSISIAKQAESKFFHNLSKLSGQDISNFIQIIEIFHLMKSELDKPKKGANKNVIQSLQRKNAKPPWTERLFCGSIFLS